VSSSDIEIGTMRWIDIEPAHAIEVQAFPDSAWSQETFWAELAGVPESRRYWVARQRNRVVGYAGLMAVPPDADVQTIAVAHDKVRSGIGGRLLSALLEEARACNCTTVMLEVAAENAPAQQLYLNHGFEQLARRSSYYGPGRDALVMRRRLDASLPATVRHE
jgi:ribosomal-protein-alanine N-acetyltransferase